MNPDLGNASGDESAVRKDTHLSSGNASEEKATEPSSVPYTIKIIPTEQETQLPEQIDYMSILYTTDKCKPTKTISQQLLPKKLKKEVTDAEIDEIYDTLQLIKVERKKQKFVSQQNLAYKSFENIFNSSKANESRGSSSGQDETKESCEEK